MLMSYFTDSFDVDDSQGRVGWSLYPYHLWQQETCIYVRVVNSKKKKLLRNSRVLSEYSTNKILHKKEITTRQSCFKWI